MELTFEDAVTWYVKNRYVYTHLCESVEGILTNILKQKKIHIHAIHSRAKEVDSFEKKIQNTKYTNPTKQITDLAGLRIISYVESDLDKICQIIKDNFDIDNENSINKTETLGTDKVGYRSIHYIVKMPFKRTSLEEYKQFADIYFEIQIRTILQHAWAEIEHDKNYKFTGKLEPHLQRRFRVLSGVLELADREFNEIAKEVDNITMSVTTDTKKGKLDISINSTSLKSYLDIKFETLINDGLSNNFYNAFYEKNILLELSKFGIETLKHIDESIPADFIKRIQELNYHKNNNYAALLRSLMMIKNSKKYFDVCWKQNFKSLHERSFILISKYVPNFREIIEQNNIKVIP